MTRSKHAATDASPTDRTTGVAATLVVASHMRSGTHLTIDLLRRNVASVSARYLNLDRLMPDHDERKTRDAFDRELLGVGALPLLKTHAPALEAWLPTGDPGARRARELLAAARVVYVVRDGRDVLVSLFYYMRHYSERARGQSFACFLRDRDDFFQGYAGFEGLDRVSAWVRHVEGWLTDPRAVVVRYEDLLARREPTLRGATRRLGLELPTRVEAVAVPSSLPRRVLRRVLAPIRPRRVSTAIAPRRGVAGDAARHFSAEDDAFFRERAGSMVERLVKLELAS